MFAFAASLCGDGLQRFRHSFSCDVTNFAGTDPVLGSENVALSPDDNEAVHALRQRHQGQKHGKEPSRVLRSLE